MKPAPPATQREAWRPRTPAPDTVDLIPAAAVAAGDVMWLWRLPSSPLTPAWYRVVHVQRATHRDTTVAWLATGADPVPILLSEDHSLLVHRTQEGP